MKVSFLIKSFTGSIAMMAMAGPALAAAQSAPSPVTLKGDVMLEKTVTENGVSTVKLSEPKVVLPGDHLHDALESMFLVARIDTLRRVADFEIRAALET